MRIVNKIYNEEETTLFSIYKIADEKLQMKIDNWKSFRYFIQFNQKFGCNLLLRMLPRKVLMSHVPHLSKQDLQIKNGEKSY